MATLLFVLTLLGQTPEAPRPRPAPARTATPRSSDLVRGEQLQYLGSFDIPQGGTWRESVSTRYDYSLGTIGYRQDKDALYVVTHEQDGKSVGLVKVPTELARGEVVVAEELEKPLTLKAIEGRHGRLLGLYWDNPTATLYYNFTVWYNVSGKDAAGLGAYRDGEFHGLWSAFHNNACGGYITRDSTSGHLIIGNAVAQGIASSSLGPSAFRIALDEKQLPPAGTRLSFLPLLFHPHGKDASETGTYAAMSTGKPWLHGMVLRGGVAIGNSLIFALDEGQNAFYGEGKEFEAKFGIKSRSSAKGYHNDPYTPMLWFYSFSDLEQVARRRATAWQPRPYQYWKITDFPEGARVAGMTYDPENRRLFISQQSGNKGRTPRIHVYRIAS